MKKVKKLVCTALFTAMALSILLPSTVSAAAAAKSNPVLSCRYIPSVTDLCQPFVSKSGVLVNITRKKVNGNRQIDIKTVMPNGKTATWSEKGPEWQFDVAYASNGKGKEIIYIYNSDRQTLRALDMSLKKRWQVKLKKMDDRNMVSGPDGSYQVSLTDKITIDGKRVKVKNSIPSVRKVGEYVFRVNENNQTYEKIEAASGKVIWEKRAFDLDGKDLKTIPQAAADVRPAFIDSNGNAYATVIYSNGDWRVVAVSSNGKILWHEQGLLHPGQTVGDLLYYSPDLPEEVTSRDYNVVVANRKTGKIIKKYGPVSEHSTFGITVKGSNLYVSGENYVEAFNSKGEKVLSYKSPKGRLVYSHNFDNKNNIYIQSAAKNAIKDKRGWIFTYSQKGKLLSKKSYDALTYSRFIVDPAGKQHYLTKYIKHKNYQSTIEVYKFK